MNTATENVLGQFLEPVFRTLPLESAKAIVDLTADERLQERVKYLASQANEGNLSHGEAEEYQSLVDAGDILATLQALVRRTLRHKGQ